MAPAHTLSIGVVAGEASGDRLGAALIEALREAEPDARFFGMAGPAMIDAGCEAAAHIDELSVMGLVEVLKSYPRLRRLRDGLVATFLRRRPDVVVGIDVPDFNLGLERRLRRGGIRTVHYVCPQAWAWREGRARRLAESADRLLALLPFEPEFFRRHGVETEFVGHPLADRIALEPDRRAARAALGIDAGGPLVALMPGSRGQEIDRLLGPFVAAARLIRETQPQARFAVGVAREADLGRVSAGLGELPATVRVGASSAILGAADVALLASGTVTLEALFCATPMVVGYRLAAPSYHIIRSMVSIPHVALPNILAGRELVPELIQNDMTPAALAQAALAWLADAARRERFYQDSRELHRSMRRDAAHAAARAVLELARGEGA
ncbi:MAG: lipid-A-disaccharide synthase [Gammaproteobacteria bacterium]